MAATLDVEVLLDDQSVHAGEVARGHVAGGAREVQILRRERSPTGTFAFHVNAVELAGEESFELDLPADSVPSWECRSCAVSYLAVARRGPRGRREQVGSTEFVVRTDAPVATRPLHLHDRLVANFDGRHFRAELAHGELHGGGQLTGRAHLQPDHEVRPQLALARCIESWRIDRSLKPNRPPIWHIDELWEQAVRLDWSQPGTWAPFSFRLADDLPPAFEGRTVAWRYEIELRRQRRFGLAHRAVITPTGFAPE